MTLEEKNKDKENMTVKDYEIRDLNEKFYRDFYIPETTCEDIVKFVNQGGDLNYDRERTLESLIFKFHNKDYLKYHELLDCMLENGLDVNARTKKKWSDSLFRGEKKNFLMMLVSSIKSYDRSSSYENKEDIINIIKVLIKHNTKFPIYKTKGKKYLEFDLENDNDIFNTLKEEKILIVPKNVKVIGPKSNTKKELDSIWDDGLLDDTLDESSSSISHETKEDIYTFEDWALEYLPNYEKGMETYEGNINCFPIITNEDTYDFEDRWSIIYSKNVTSLKGCPKHIKGNFNCSNNQLRSLEFGPVKVEGNYICSQNYLKSLDFIAEDIKGYIDSTDNFNLKDIQCDSNTNFIYYGNKKSPQKLSLKNLIIYNYPKEKQDDYIKNYDKYISGEKVWEGDIDCAYNYGHTIFKIDSLEGCPKKIDGSFNCEKNEITSLEDGPNEVKGSYNCNGNKITSLKGAPKIVYATFDCGNNKLKTLEYAPLEVIKTTTDYNLTYSSFRCYDNQLESLEFISKVDDEIGKIDCARNKIKSLKGLKNKALKNIDLANNELESLEGCPDVINDSSSSSFNVSYNNLTSLTGGPKIVKCGYDCSFNKLTSLEGLAKKIEGKLDCSMNRLKDVEQLKYSEIDKEIILDFNPELKGNN